VGLRDRRASWDGGYFGSDTAALAAVFDALLRLAPDDPRQALVRDALLARATAEDGWGTTHDNHRALAALAAYLGCSHGTGVRANVTLARPAGNLALALDGTHKVAHAADTSDQPLKAQVSGNEGGAPLGARVAYTYVPAAAGKDAPPLRQGFLVQRSATLLGGSGDGTGTRLDDQSKDKGQGARWTTKLGDVLELHTQLTTDQERTQVALVIPLAAGLELLNPELANSSEDAKPSEADTTTPTYVERRDEEVRYYFTRLPAGTHAFHLRARATTQGRFSLPGAWAEAMYHPQHRGRSAGLEVTVQGPAGK
jgi:uncharacterized protein YfaS (alpha-2-macroglobulin family)